jgi:hypothetical protein
MEFPSFNFLFLFILITNICLKECQTFDVENSSSTPIRRSYKEDDLPKAHKSKTKSKRQYEIQQIKRQVVHLVGKDLAYIVENIFEMIGSFNSVFIFDCEQPSYIDSSNQLVRLKTYLKEELKLIGKCERKDHVWHDVLDQDKMLGFSYSRNNITKSLYDIREILKLFNRHNACDDLLKFLKHPSTSFKNYEKPLECKSSNKPFTLGSQTESGKFNIFKTEIKDTHKLFAKF